MEVDDDLLAQVSLDSTVDKGNLSKTPENGQHVKDKKPTQTEKGKGIK